MKRLLIITLLAIGCSKSTDTTKDNPEYKYNGTWLVSNYTQYDATGNPSKPDWSYDAVIINKESSKAIKNEETWTGTVKYWENTVFDSISIKIDGQPEVTGNIENRGAASFGVTRKEKGYSKESWILTQK